MTKRNAKEVLQLSQKVLDLLATLLGEKVQKARKSKKALKFARKQSEASESAAMPRGRWAKIARKFSAAEREKKKIESFMKRYDQLIAKSKVQLTEAEVQEKLKLSIRQKRELDELLQRKASIWRRIALVSSSKTHPSSSC